MGTTDSKISHNVDRSSYLSKRVHSLPSSPESSIHSRSLTREKRQASRSSIGASSTSSQSSDSPDFKWLCDRKFMADTLYMLPCDDREMDRGVLESFMIKSGFSGEFVHAPIKDTLKQGGRVLDIGCGSGTWCMDVAQEFPKSFVTGIDIMPNFPDMVHPPNCNFEVVDVSRCPLPFEDNTFDLVSIQVMLMAITGRQFSNLLVDIKRILKDDGWLQWIEPDVTAWKCGPLTLDVVTRCRQVMDLRDLDPSIIRKSQSFLKNAGYFRIKRRFISFPLGEWGGRYGKTMEENFFETLASLGPLFCATFGWSAEELVIRAENVRNELVDYRAYINYHLIIACKSNVPEVHMQVENKQNQVGNTQKQVENTLKQAENILKQAENILEQAENTKSS